MTTTRLVVERNYGAAKKAIASGLEAFNRRRLGALRGNAFAITLRDGDDVSGGIVAEIMGDWLVVGLLWVAEPYRGKEHGRALLREAETEARKRGAINALVDSYSFQAPEFYRREGYEAYGVVEGFPLAGERWVRLRKSLR